MIAALFVASGGCYFDLPDVDPWDQQRDARLYRGPHRVIAHPPCERWGRYWNGGPNCSTRRSKGDDQGCFVSALDSVRQWGGVLEHPAGSHAWEAFGIYRPPPHGGWVNADFVGGWTCQIEQGHFGHRARKSTWLYACGVPVPSLPWGASVATARIDSGGFHSREERARARLGQFVSDRARARFALPKIETREAAATPPAFRDLLISIASSGAP